MCKRSVLYLSLTVLLLATIALATAQRGDALKMNGKTYFIYTNPLESYLAAHPGTLSGERKCYLTSLWRGYVATWTLKAQQLVLVDVEVPTCDQDHEFQSVMAKMFPGQKEVVADWFKGHIIVPNGERVQYTHMGYASTYEKYIVLRVENGSVTQNREVNLDEFKRFSSAQFAAFKKTERYRKALAEAQKESGMSARENEEFLRQYYSVEYLSMIFDDQPSR